MQFLQTINVRLNSFFWVIPMVLFTSGTFNDLHIIKIYLSVIEPNLHIFNGIIFTLS